MSVISFDNRDGWIWQNGSFVEWNNAKTHIISQGLHYASSVFEGERAYNGVIFKSQEHTDRLFKSAEILGIEIPYTKDQINSAKEELIKKMNYKNCYVRAIAWHGAKVMGVSTKGNVTHVAIAAWDDWANWEGLLVAIIYTIISIAATQVTKYRFLPYFTMGLTLVINKDCCIL